MTHKQHPLHTGFTPAATADEVLAGINLSGKNVIVTGGHAGIGLETTRALSKAGAFVTVGSRNPDQAALALAGIERVEVSQLDLIDPHSIDAFAARWLHSGRPLHILINGAAASGGPVRDARGYDTDSGKFINFVDELSSGADGKKIRVLRCGATAGAVPDGAELSGTRMRSTSQPTIWAISSSPWGCCPHCAPPTVPAW